MYEQIIKWLGSNWITAVILVIASGLIALPKVRDGAVLLYSWFRALIMRIKKLIEGDKHILPPKKIRELLKSGIKFIDFTKKTFKGSSDSTSEFFYYELKMRETNQSFIFRAQLNMPTGKAAEFLASELLPELSSESYEWALIYEDNKIPSYHTFKTAGITSGKLVYLEGKHKRPIVNPAPPPEIEENKLMGEIINKDGSKEEYLQIDTFGGGRNRFQIASDKDGNKKRILAIEKVKQIDILGPSKLIEDGRYMKNIWAKAKITLLDGTIMENVFVKASGNWYYKTRTWESYINDDVIRITFNPKHKTHDRIDKLILDLKSDNLLERKNAVQFLSKFNDPRVIQAFISLLNDSDHNWNIQLITQTLSKFKEHRALEPLIMLLRNKNKGWIIRYYAAIALADFGDPVAIPHLIEALNEEVVTGGPHGGCMACEVGKFKDSRLVDPLIKALSIDNDSYRASTIEALSNQKISTKILDEIIKRLMFDTSDKIRMIAARTLGKMHLEKELRNQAILALEEAALNDQDSKVRKEASKAKIQIQ